MNNHLEKLFLKSIFVFIILGIFNIHANALAAGYPAIAATSTYQNSSAATSNNVTLPSGIQAGDLLMLVFRGGSTATASTPSGWSLLSSIDSTTLGHTYIWYKTASGSEGATVAITSTNIRVAAIGYRISGWTGTPEIATSTTNDPPALSPSWGTADTLWIAGMTNRISNSSVTAAPANYSNLITIAENGSGATSRSRVSTANRSLTASSDDPGTFTTSGTIDSPEAFTIAIKPLAIPPSAPIFSDSDGTNQISFNNIRESTTTPDFIVSAVSSSSFDAFQLELNSVSDFSSTSYTETFSGAYASGTKYNLLAAALSPSLPATDGATYYVRARASSDGGTNYSSWSAATQSFTYKTGGNPDWFETTGPQFNTGSLSGSIETTSSGTADLLDTSKIYFTDFSGYATGSKPSDWTEKWSASANDWFIRDDATAAGGKVLRSESTTSPFNLLSWNVLDGVSGDANIFFIYKVPATNTDAFAVARASGTSYVSATGVIGGYDSSSSTEDIGYYDSGSSAVNASSSFSPSANRWYKARASFSGNYFKYKTWLAADNEPSSWDIQSTSSATTSAGWIGLMSSISAATGTSFGAFGVNVGGGSAPISAATDTGSIISPPVNFNYVPGMISWNQASWSADETYGSTSVQVYYSSTAPCDTIIPDSALSGNSAGFSSSTSPLDLSGLSTTTYNSICLKATLNGTGTTSPSLNDWSVSWRNASGTAQITQTDNYGWRTNDPNQNSESYASVNAPLTSGVNMGDQLRLRIQVSNTGTGIASNYQYRLEYASSDDSCTSWYPVPAFDNTMGPWAMSISKVGNNTSTTNSSKITDPAGKTFVPGYVKTQEDQTTAMSLTTSQFTELEYSIYSISNIDTSSAYCFRVTNAGDSSNFVYGNLPEVSVVAPVVKNRGGKNVESSAAANSGKSGGNENGGSGTEQSSSTATTTVSTTTPPSNGGGGGDVGLKLEQHVIAFGDSVIWLVSPVNRVFDGYVNVINAVGSSLSPLFISK